eukprot:TRINITY_DN11299_c0_g1_i1.p1 TRINITY_DN11299_c0_g1~~TRINITY_DN11299_c0_g1_i1.p1  ORF type:complete len:277 (+),score=108.99 TRINITY_DN11299_c0_g1_i1:22-831(+)
MVEKRVGFLGAGKMAEAIIRGMLAAGISPESVFISDIVAERLEFLSHELGVKPVANNEELFSKCDVLVFATKPQHAQEAGVALKEFWNDNKIMVSIMAGKPVSFLLSIFGPNTKAIRVMPNTPATVQLGLTALCKSETVSDEDFAFVEKMFSGCGKTIEVEEKFMDVVTATSGSGPAYVFYLAECWIKASMAEGLSEEQATTSVKQTILGAAQLMMDSPKSPAQLRKDVCSPGGTTLAGLSQMEKDLTCETMMHDVIKAARDRSIELSK